jgi:hypothetical protein
MKHKLIRREACSSKDTITEIKMQGADWENIYLTKDLCSEYIKTLTIQKKRGKPSKDGQKTSAGTSQKKIYE